MAWWVTSSVFRNAGWATFLAFAILMLENFVNVMVYIL
jgi:hypothetical protein